MAEIKVSVIIPVYNMEKYIEKCLNSVLQQTLKEIEIICVDDGSTDKSLDILNQYKSTHACMIILSQKNQGSGSARNAGIDVARGEFVAFIDPDDYYAGRDILEYLYNCAKREGVTICGGGMLYEREGRISKSKEKSEFFIEDGKIVYKNYQRICGYTAFVFQRILLKKYSIYFPNYRRFQDIPFIVNAMTYAEIFYAVSRPVYVYRIVDKLIPFHSEEVVNGIAQGIDDVLLISKEMHYGILHADIIQKMLNGYIDLFYKSIYDGNKTMKTLLQKIWDDMDEELLILDGRMKTKPILKSEEEINEYIIKNREEKEKLWKHINQFQHVIIYGAGMVGKRLFEYIANNAYNGTVEFGVSDPSPNGTACGKQIRSIDSYLQYKNDALVLIALKGSGRFAMLDIAKKLGYRNVEIVDYDSLILF